MAAIAAMVHSRSSRADLVAYRGNQPVISSAMVMDYLGITCPTTLSLLGKLIEGAMSMPDFIYR